jgi:hypothetical protein
MVYEELPTKSEALKEYELKQAEVKEDLIKAKSWCNHTMMKYVYRGVLPSIWATRGSTG